LKLRELPFFEFGHGDDIAVHLDQYLIDDFRAQRHHGQSHGGQHPESRQSLQHCNSLEFNILTEAEPARKRSLTIRAL